MLGSGPFAEDVDADVGEVEGDSGGEGGVYWEGEAGEVNQGGDGSGDEGGVAGILFEALDKAADAVVFAADFWLEAGFDEGEELTIAEGLGGAGAELEEVFEGDFGVLGELEVVEGDRGFGVGGEGLAVGGEVEHGGKGEG